MKDRSICEYSFPYCRKIINKFINRKITQDNINALHDKDYYIKMLYKSIKPILINYGSIQNKSIK